MLQILRTTKANKGPVQIAEKAPMSLYLLKPSSSRGKRSACGADCFYEAHESIFPFHESRLLTLASSLIWRMSPREVFTNALIKYSV
jgi:hypothetical protein